jgi:hypothetical protein
MIHIKGNLILEKDITFEEDLKVDGNILGEDGNRYNLTVKGGIDALNINAWDIDAGNINAENINARYINAGNINAWDIDAWNINALDISYYAVCFACYDITCKSIKGRRANCKHFVLDGEIKIKDDVEEIIEHNGRKYKLIKELSQEQGDKLSSKQEEDELPVTICPLKDGKDEISLCKSCYSMTKTIKGKCGKCGSKK